jgi:hypothetical protein
VKSAPALGLALLLLAGSAAAQTFPFTREVEIPAPGWVRVPLDLTTIQHLAPDGVDLHVLDPAGREVPRRLLSLLPRIAQRRIRVAAVLEGVEGVEGVEGDRGDEGTDGDGWSVLLDAGAEPPLHDGLFLQVSPARPIAQVRLEGSTDGTSWRGIDQGALLPTRSGSAALLYPPTRDRYLRLSGAGEPPAVPVAEIETVQGLSLAATTGESDCDRGRPGVAVCRLALPASGVILRRLTVDLRGEGATVGYRLLAPARGRWQVLAEGVWQRAGERTGHAALDQPRRLTGGFVRLELYGPAGGAPPRLAGHDADLAVPVVVFRAPAPGRYTLASGGLSRGTPARQGPPAGLSNGGGVWVRPGPERAGAEPELAAGAPRRASWGDRRFNANWTVAAPGVQAGRLVRLEIPDAVYTAARPDLGDLRVASGGQEIPYLRWSPADPAPAAEVRNLRPEPGEAAERLERDLPLPAAGLPLTELWLSTPARRLRGSYSARYAALSPIRARRREVEAVSARAWECDPEPPLPCREVAALSGRALDALAVRLEGVEPGTEGGDLSVDLMAWRRRDVLLFAWPGKGPVRLLAGSAELAAPSYELAALGPLLLARPWQPAELDLAAALSPKAPRWGGWVGPGLLIAATILFLLLLRRILPDV